MNGLKLALIENENKVQDSYKKKWIAGIGVIWVVV